MNRPIPVAKEIATTNQNGRAENATPLIRRSSGLIVRKADPEAAKFLLAELDEFDEAEQRETLAFLKKALNETRATQGARLIFPDEQTDLA